jgi:hypothetical protein
MFLEYKKIYNKTHMESKIINATISKIIHLVSIEIDNKETQILIKQRLIYPIITMIYKELYPYIIALVITILFILLITILTFVGFVFAYLKKL